jgi:two-component system chemotaxis response regulator CheY
MNRVLIVDDSNTMRRVIRKAVAMAGVAPEDIGEAADGVEALESMERGRSDLIVCDVNMPRMGGTELLAELGRRYGKEAPPVVMVTSVANVRTRLELTRLGAVTVLRKPFAPGDLPKALAPYLPTKTPEHKVPAEADVVGYYDGAAVAPTLALVRPVDDADIAETAAGEWEEAATAAAQWETAAPAPPEPAEPEVAPAPAGPPGLSSTDVHVATALAQAAQAFLENMAFVDATPAWIPVPSDRIVVFATCGFDGPGHGWLRVATTLDVADTLAETLTGDAPGLDDTRRLDAVAEIANVLAGELFHQFQVNGITGGGDYVLGLPESDVAGPGRLDWPNSLAFDIDGTGRHLFVEVVS